MIAGRYDVLLAALLGLATTSSSMIGAALGLRLQLSKRLLASTLAFAAGSLMAALAIELAFKSADSLHHQGFAPRVAWAFVSGGFALGAVIYYTASLALEMRGGAVRYQTRFLEYARERKQRDTRMMIALLSQCDLLRHLPPEEIEGILPCVSSRELAAGQVLFRAGDPGDALYIVAEGEVAVLGPAPAGKGGDADATLPTIAALRQGQAFGEMALLSGGARTATIRAVTDTILLRIAKEDFERLVVGDPQIAAAVERLSHGRAISNLSVGSGDPATWARMASLSLDHVTRSEASRLLREAGKDSGLAIVLRQYPRHDPGMPGDRRQVRRLRQSVADLDARHVHRRHTGGRGERCHVTQGRLSSEHDLRPVGDRAGCRPHRGGSRQDVHRQLGLADGHLLPSDRRRSRAGADHARHDPGSLA